MSEPRNLEVTLPSAKHDTADTLDHHARDVADLSRAGESDDRRVFFRSDRRSRLRGWIPMAVEGTSAPGRIAQGL